MTGVEELGRGGRLRGGAAGELVAAAYAAESAHGPRLAHGLSLADLAHAVALVEGGNVHGEDARALLRGLLELHEIPGDDFPWDPAAGDAFNAREAELERRVGRSAAGWLSAGRPRREAFRVGLRLTARARALDLYDALGDQAAALARHARDTETALAADYTYLQPAQPTTVGHLLLAYAYPALRDAERLRATYGALGLSVAGAGGSAGSRWSLDRSRLAELLGCDGPHRARQGRGLAGRRVRRAARHARDRGDPPERARRRTSRSTPARSSGSSSSPTRTAARAP